MSTIEFPAKLNKLLEGSKFQAAIRDLADRVGLILADNKLEFFPDYTDHGVDHINAVLQSQVKLIPDDVWQLNTDSKLLTDADAAVIIGGTLLHDIGMHLREAGFLELVSKGSRFKPLPWFSENHEGHGADRPWHDLWNDYVREAKRFSDRQLTNIVGESSAQTWKFEGLHDDSGQWTRNDKLIIGEFLRRHHARLAHEIAIHGFPGLTAGSNDNQFPAIGENRHPLKNLADLMGVSARSHGMSLRVCQEYLKSMYDGTPRPKGVAILYPMALLRVADYLQLERSRAPAVLLVLRNPQSPISVQEWSKHDAVTHIGPANDPRAKFIQVNEEIPLSIFLQLKTLIEGLQREIDHSTAVLDEAYGTQTVHKLDKLGLAIRRVRSNLDDPAFQARLPYVPQAIGFSSDPNLLSLLVSPLYGDEPSVGVRELIQNAVDAVRELAVWCEKHGPIPSNLELYQQEPDVLVEFIEEDGKWSIRVTDKGIGMTADTIQNYFLRAGATFRRSPEWTKEFIDDDGSPAVLRAGRFGIGAFAIFLLGDSFSVATRHVGSTEGVSFQGSFYTTEIELKRNATLPVGTSITVQLRSESLTEEKLGRITGFNWYCWEWPKVERRLIRSGSSELLDQRSNDPWDDVYKFPNNHTDDSPTWSRVETDKMDGVFWSFHHGHELSCNGMVIMQPKRLNFNDSFDWQMNGLGLRRPSVAVMDFRSRLPLTIDRYRLIDPQLPFQMDLVKDMFESYLAYELLYGARSLRELFARKVCPHLTSRSSDTQIPQAVFSCLCNNWIGTVTEMTLAEKVLFSQLKSKRYLVLCVICRNSDHQLSTESAFQQLVASFTDLGLPIAAYHLHMPIIHHRPSGEKDYVLGFLMNRGIGSLGSGQRRVSVWTPFSGFDIDVPAYRSEDARSYDWHMDEPEVSSNRDLIKKRRLNSLRKKVSALFPNGPIVLIGEFEAMKGENNSNSYDQLIADTWIQSIGERAIPFEADARESLIKDVCKSSQMKRHIERWRRFFERASTITQPQTAP